MSGALSINQANRQEWRDYQNALSQISAQNAAGNNALLGSGIGAVGTIGGAAIGSALMPAAAPVLLPTALAGAGSSLATTRR
jgi:hypothetical protein